MLITSFLQKKRHLLLFFQACHLQQPGLHQRSCCCLTGFPKFSSNNWTGYTSLFTSSPSSCNCWQQSSLCVTKTWAHGARHVWMRTARGFHIYQIGLQTAGIILCVCWGPSSSQTKGTSRKSLPFQSLSKGREGWIWTGRNKGITFLRSQSRDDHMNENEKISCNNDDHKSKNTNTKLLYKNESLPFPEDLTAWRPHLMMWGACLSTGRSTKWWSQKLHKKEYGHMVICMEMVQDMYFQHITDWGSGCWDYWKSSFIVQVWFVSRPGLHQWSLCLFKVFAM